MMSFGESHGPGVGVVIDGCPAGVPFDESLLLKELARRRPGQSDLVSARNEADRPEILSGIFNGVTLGTPIAILVRNEDARSDDYKKIQQNPRPGHADDLWKDKFGHVDHRGGGRASGRETLSRVIAGSIAQMMIRTAGYNLQAVAYSQQIGPIIMGEVNEEDRYRRDEFAARFPDRSQSDKVVTLLREAMHEGKSYGGVVELIVQDVPRGLGQPVFRKLKADLATAMMSIGATTAIEFGEGVRASFSEGTQFHQSMQNPNYGGIRGGLSTGEDIVLRIHFKPTSSVLDVAKKGRHDPCIVPRAVPVVEAMAYLVMADHLLQLRLDKVKDND